MARCTLAMRIRSEQITDIPGIHQLTTDAFAPKSFSDGTEPQIIDDLRTTGDLTLSLIAEQDELLLGHVAFSLVTINEIDKQWYGLGPISVTPDLQGEGIGSALINEGLNILRGKGARGCALVGDPNYYSRFGFISDGNLRCIGFPDEHVQWISFNGESPIGQLAFNPAFGD